MNDRFLEDLKNRIDIVDIVRRYAELKKSGKNYMCRSPFRNERTPSFSVSPDKQFWYDFGNSEGGDVISFIEKIENISFQEAVELLADMAGVEVPKTIKSTEHSKEEKKDIFLLHEKACQYFESQFQASAIAQEYLQKRAIDTTTQNIWRLGYGGDVADGLTKFLLKEGFSQKAIAASGVAFELEFGDKTMKDRFDKRIIIPVRDPKEGKIIAFTGREIFGRDTAKYINSPENAVYHKSATLFGLYEGRKAIREKDAVILVEGNFDVISAHKAGFTNTIATCGTSLTEDHLRILKRLTPHLYLAFDADIAGKKATLRAVEMCLQMEISPFVIDIPGAKDFDELVREDAQKLKQAIEKAENAVTFLLHRFARKYLNGTMQGETKFLDALFYFVKLMRRPVEIDYILSQIGLRMNRSKVVIEEEFRKFVRGDIKYKKIKEDAGNQKKFTREEAFVGFLSAHWEFFQKQNMGEKLLEVLKEPFPQEILKKILFKTPLENDQKNILMGWELHQELLYGEDASHERLTKDFKLFIDILRRDQIKQERLISAQEIGASLKAQAALIEPSELENIKDEIY